MRDPWCSDRRTHVKNKLLVDLLLVLCGICLTLSLLHIVRRKTWLLIPATAREAVKSEEVVRCLLRLVRSLSPQLLLLLLFRLSQWLSKCSGVWLQLIFG